MTPSLVLVGCCRLAGLLAAQSEPLQVDPVVVPRFDERMRVTSSVVADDAVLPVVQDPTPAQPMGRLQAAVTIPIERLAEQVPDPDRERARAQAGLSQAQTEPERNYFRNVLERLNALPRPKRFELTLESALQRALASNYAIRVVGYNPGIDQTRVVEAEAAFDAAFFVNFDRDKANRPTANRFTANNSTSLNLQGGFRKLLPTGMQVSTALGWNYLNNDLPANIQSLNPTHFSSFAVEFRQPLLRGFGLDVNRAQIRLARNDRRISIQDFEQQVRQTLDNVERAYWQLVAARRDVVISARLLATFQQIYDYLDQRKDFDAFRIQISDTKARLETAKAGFVQVQQNLRNSEDRVIALMNDPEINLSSSRTTELVPTDFPTFAPLVVDLFGEVQTALDNRSEIREAKLRIENARLLVGVQKNQALPQLDLTFRYTVDGLGESADDAFDEVSKNDFHEYFVAIQFELPVGNRARRAALQRARLQWAQQIAVLKQTFEQVILETNVAVREMLSSYEQIDPNYQSALANQDQVESIVRRAERRDFTQLSQELSANQALANSRRNLVNSVVEYNIAIVNLERAKGTLLQYNNVVLPEPDE